VPGRWVYLTDGRLASLADAADAPMLAAASNWHALARFAGRFAPHGRGLLLDIGSTTCDLIPLIDGRVFAAGTTDTTRLLYGELVYTGVERSPCCAIARQVRYRGQLCPVTQELFATMKDVYLVLGDTAENPADCDTADGRPATIPFAQQRLGRMIAADEREFTADDAKTLADDMAAQQVWQLAAGLRLVSERLSASPDTVILSGHGDFLALPSMAMAEFQPGTVISLKNQLGPDASRCAPAHALAVLAREELEA
jgi:probable H4MPT-linked C1 transfer pathway protein